VNNYISFCSVNSVVIKTKKEKIYRNQTVFIFCRILKLDSCDGSKVSGVNSGIDESESAVGVDSSPRL
jgi:hypothetical protein